MIIPEDDGFVPVTTSNLNSFNNIMVIKVADSGKSSGETTYQLSTLDRSRGLCGWPADRHLHRLLPDHEMRIEQVNEPNKKQINLYADTSAVKPKLFCGREINYKFKRNHQNPSQKKPKLPRTNLEARFASNSRAINNPRPWKEKSWEPKEPPKFDPPVKNRNIIFPRNGPGLLGDCPVARIQPNAPSASFVPFPPPAYPNFPPHENHTQNSSAYESKFDGMEPLKNFSCIKRDSRKERESGHHYRGSYPQSGKIQGSQLKTSDEPYNKYTETEREQPCPSYRYSYNGNETAGRSHISPDMNKRNFKGNFRNELNSYENELDDSYVGNEASGRSHVSPGMDNRDFRGNFRNEHSFENQREGFNNDRSLNNNQKPNYPRKPWQEERKFVPNQKRKFGVSTNSDYRRKTNSYYSPFRRRPWASPMRAQNNSTRRNRRF